MKYQCTTNAIIIVISLVSSLYYVLVLTLHCKRVTCMGALFRWLFMCLSSKCHAQTDENEDNFLGFVSIPSLYLHAIKSQ